MNIKIRLHEFQHKNHKQCWSTRSISNRSHPEVGELQSTSRPGQSAEAVHASALQKPGRRHIATNFSCRRGRASPAVRGVGNAAAGAAEKASRRGGARRGAPQVLSARNASARRSRGDAAGQRGADAAPAGPQRPQRPLLRRSPPGPRARRLHCPGGRPRRRIPSAPGGGGRGGALTSPPLPHLLQEGGSWERGSDPPQLPAATPKLGGWLPGQVLTNLVSLRPSL